MTSVICSTGLEQGATFDATGTYRYLLWRTWNPAADRVLFVMLNPSTADATRDDPTIRRCIAFARAWGHGGVEVVNLFAWRSTSPSLLRIAPDPVGPDNDRVLMDACGRAARIVFAWGNHGSFWGRDRQVKSLLGGQTFCLGFTRTGQPRHPLYLRQTTGLQPCL